MEPTYNDLISEILSLVQYSDKEKFIREFELMNQLEAIEKSIKKFPQHLQDSMLRNGSTPEEVIQYIQPDAYYEELVQVSAKALAEFLHHLQSVLTVEQKEKIAQILHKFS